jgi:glycosyltransferase involved in cell wall biosynthesis
MRFTIVTPVRNGLPWIKECVASVDAQRRDVDVEHLVLDAGSTDGTREWLREHATRASLFFEPDKGQTDALIRGFARATGDVFGWLNADDVLEPRALARARDALVAHPAAVGVSGCALTVDSAGRVLGTISTPSEGTLAGLLRSASNLAQPSTFFRATSYRAAGGLDPSVDLAMDVSLWLRLARLGDFHLLRDDVLSCFRVHPDARSVRAAARTAREDLHLRRAAGMRLLSPAGLSLMRYAYVHPLLAPLWRRLPRVVRDAVRPGKA